MLQPHVILISFVSFWYQYRFYKIHTVKNQGTIIEVCVIVLTKFLASRDSVNNFDF